MFFLHHEVHQEIRRYIIVLHMINAFCHKIRREVSGTRFSANTNIAATPWLSFDPFVRAHVVLVLVLVLNKDHVNHQKDAHHLASVYPGYILMSLFFVLCSYLGRSLDQADACHMASVHLGFILMSGVIIWHRKTHAVFASSLTSTQVWSQPD